MQINNTFAIEFAHLCNLLTACYPVINVIPRCLLGESSAMQRQTLSSHPVGISLPLRFPNEHDSLTAAAGYLQCE
jgi:hypothetical protein